MIVMIFCRTSAIFLEIPSHILENSHTGAGGFPTVILGYSRILMNQGIPYIVTGNA